MKCPKCGYISFDYNQICPKCNKNISAEQAKLNLPSFKPDTPALLGAFIGEPDDSSIGVQRGASVGIDSGEHEMGVSFDDSGPMEADEVEFEGGEDFDMSLDSDETGEMSAFDSPELEPPAAQPEIPPEQSVTDFDLEGEEEETSVEAGDASIEEAETATIHTPETGLEEEELGMDLDSMALEVEDTSQETVSPGEEEEEVALNLDNLKIDDSGELNLDEDAEPSEELENGLEVGEVPLEEPSPEGETSKETGSDSEETDIELEAISRDMEDTSGASKETDELSLDLDDLDIELDLEEPDQKPS